MKRELSWQTFEKFSNIIKIRFSCRADGRTDMTKLILFAFRNFANAPKNAICCILTLILLMWRMWLAPNNASKWQMGFNSAFKGLI